MRYGICLNMLSAQPDGTGIENAAAAKEAGFDYLELPLAEMAAMTGDAFTSLARQVEASGLRCECCNNLFPKSMRLTGPQTDLQAIRAYLTESIRRAALLGVSVVVFGSGPAKRVPEGFPLEDGYLQAVSIARIAAEVAAPYGIGIAVEPLRTAECNLINTYKEACRLVRDTARENIHALVDYYHLSQMEEPAAHIQNEGQYLRHVHFARNAGRAFPAAMDEDSHGYTRFAEALKAIGYGGRISLEAYAQDVRAEAPKALAFMRALFGA